MPDWLPNAYTEALAREHALAGHRIAKCETCGCLLAELDHTDIGSKAWHHVASAMQDHPPKPIEIFDSTADTPIESGFDVEDAEPVNPDWPMKALDEPVPMRRAAKIVATTSELGITEVVIDGLHPADIDLASAVIGAVERRYPARLWQIAGRTVDAPRTPLKSRSISTRCPACRNTTLMICDDGDLVCSWVECPDPTLLHRMMNAQPGTLPAPVDAMVHHAEDGSRLGNILAQFAGACSMCWEPRPSTAVFDSTRAKTLCDETEVEIRRHFLGSNDVRTALVVIGDAMRHDLDYAWSWHCNIAMAFLDSRGDATLHTAHEIANLAAARFLKQLFNVDTTGHRGFVTPEPPVEIFVTEDTPPEDVAASVAAEVGPARQLETAEYMRKGDLWRAFNETTWTEIPSEMIGERIPRLRTWEARRPCAQKGDTERVNSSSPIPPHPRLAELTPGNVPHRAECPECHGHTLAVEGINGTFHVCASCRRSIEREEEMKRFPFPSWIFGRFLIGFASNASRAPWIDSGTTTSIDGRTFDCFVILPPWRHKRELKAGERTFGIVIGKERLLK